ncbi:MAG: hypothetical protein JST12_17155 [Armatimonadetes bacterium]|nr:hypothetical protein [Armatimonadota bacterium]
MAKTAPRKKPNGNRPVPQQPFPKKEAPKEPEAPKAPTVRVHPLVVAFVVYHIIAVTTYALPIPSKKVLDDEVPARGTDILLKYNQKEVKNWAPIYSYLYVTGFWQYWDMFAPDPAQTDLWCSAEITYFDGTKKEFHYPRIKDLTIPQKFVYERHRKYFERVNITDYAFLWPSFAQAIAYQCAEDTNNPPVEVTLIRHFQPVMRHNDPKPQEPPYTAVKFYWYAVDQHELFADKGWKLGIH